MSNKSDRTLVAKYPISGTAEDTVSMLQTLIAHEDVKHLEYMPEDGFVRVVHYVEGDVPTEEDEGWDAALRNVETMEEYDSPGAEPFQVVFDMMHLVSHFNCNPVQWVVGAEGTGLLEKWFDLEDRGMPGGGHQLMGVPLMELKSLPQESLILCGSKYSAARPEETTYAVKTTVEIRNNHEHGILKDGTDVDRGGNGAAERGESAQALEAAAAGLRIPKWYLGGPAA